MVAVPAGSTSGAVRVIANNSTVSNQDLVFTMPNPIVTGLAPASGPTGTQVRSTALDSEQRKVAVPSHSTGARWQRPW